MNEKGKFIGLHNLCGQQDFFYEFMSDDWKEMEVNFESELQVLKF